MTDVQKKIKELTDKINNHNIQYYVFDNTQVYIKDNIISPENIKIDLL